MDPETSSDPSVETDSPICANGKGNMGFVLEFQLAGVDLRSFVVEDLMPLGIMESEFRFFTARGVSDDEFAPCTRFKLAVTLIVLGEHVMNAQKLCKSVS